MLSSFEDKLKDVQAIDISQYVSVRGKSTGDSAAASLPERRAVVCATTGAAAHTEQAEGRTYNDAFHFVFSGHSLFTSLSKDLKRVDSKFQLCVLTVNT